MRNDHPVTPISVNTRLIIIPNPTMHFITSSLVLLVTPSNIITCNLQEWYICYSFHFSV